MSRDDPAKSSVVLDRELDQEESVDPSGPRIRCPLSVVAPHGRPLALYLPPPAEHVRYRRSVPGVPPPLDLNPMSLVCPLVAAFRLVSAMTRNRLMVLEFAASFANACWRSILNHGDNEILWRCTTQQARASTNAAKSNAHCRDHGQLLATTHRVVRQQLEPIGSAASLVHWTRFSHILARYSRDKFYARNLADLLCSGLFQITHRAFYVCGEGYSTGVTRLNELGAFVFLADTENDAGRQTRGRRPRSPRLR